MCTVSFIAYGKKVFITSNRDENRLRQPSVAPMSYSYSFGEMIYPKDGEAGGSWISICGNGNAAVLLNGAFEPHKKDKSYKKSRGIIFLEILNTEMPLQKFLLYPLFGIEPFTIILWQQGNLYELSWDEGRTKHCTCLSIYRPLIWSSVTLYNKDGRQKRQRWFDDWVRDEPQPSLEAINRFHRIAGESDSENALFKRSNTITTVSITTMALDEQAGTMIYTDFITGKTTKTKIIFS